MAPGNDRRYADFLHDLKQGVSSVYVLTGNDEFLKREALRRITEALVPVEARQFNCESFLGSETAWSDVEAACLSAPLFADRRVVALMGVENFGQVDAAGLVAYARRPSRSTCLVVMTGGGGDEGKRRRVQSLAGAMRGVGEGVAAYAFWQASKPDCRAWARAWLRGQGRTMSEQLFGEVSEAYGHSAYEVWNVIEKASSHAGGRKEITEQDVAAVGGAASLGSARELRRVVACGDGAAAHVTAARCLESGVQPTLLIWTLNRAFRHAMRSVEPPSGQAGRFGTSGAGKDLRWPESRDVGELRRRLDAGGLSRAVWRLYETEKGIKTGALDPTLALDTLINELTGPAAMGYRKQREW
ncbi:MAG: DNA polymerase III subunit delta [Candidatus Eisenbacteria bacterium]|nr:DNA polymerase III subunit delta [Candidatus Eisenbacteria bacterium]